MNRDAASSSTRESATGGGPGNVVFRRPEGNARSHRRGAKTRHGRLRIVYFTVASVWGFAAGSVAVLAGFNAVGQSIHFDSGVGVTLGVAAAIAIVGGVIISLAYREAIRRGM